MTKSAKSRAATTTRKRKPAAKGKANAGAATVPRTAKAARQPTPKEEAAFVETVIASGEAARLDDKGRLPAGATHTIVEDAEGNVKVVRRRFSMT